MVSILGANSVVSGGYEVSNSLRFNQGDSPVISKTPSSSSNQKTMTFSFWIKRCHLDDEFYFLYSAGQDANNRDGIRFYNNSLDLIIQRNDTTYYRLLTTAKFRDVAAWYHIVIAIDTTDSTSSNRFKMYVNGSQITDFQTETYPTQNLDLYFNENSAQYIGRFFSSDSSHYDGYVAEWNFIDGAAKAPTDFGEFNDNNVWIPKEYTGSYGTNGFFLEFKQTGTSQNASGIGADTSGNGNHFAVTNLAGTDVTTDTCTNNYCTLNGVRGAIGGNYDNGTLSEGNLKFVTPNQSIFSQQEGTIFPTSGKWYWEVFFVSSGNDAGVLGIQRSGLDIGAYPGKTANGYGYDSYGSGLKIHNNSSSAYGSSYGANDIIGVALDLDNGTLTFYKNNSSQGQAFSGIDSSLGWSFSYGAGYLNTFVVNFGQEGSFAGNKTAQGNSDANGYGDFYYSPPSGYYALNTKNLAEFG
jgi:hypothetical protein